MNYSIDLSKLNFENLPIEPFSMTVGLICGLLIGMILLLWRVGVHKSRAAGLQARLEAERAGLDDHFKALAQATLQSNSENFLNIAQEKLKAAQADSAHDLDKRTQAIAQMIQPVEKHLTQLNGVVEQLSATDRTIREDIQNLSKETAKLTGALKNPAAQGKWGEFVLERLLDKANLIKGLHYETQVSINTGESRLRPDAIIHLQDGFNIIVDAKAPITEFINRMDDDMGEGEYNVLRQNLARAVRSHVKALGSKSYWEQVDSPDFVVLFLPSENIFSTALSADPDLVDYASDNNVVIASPTLLMSLLRVVGLSWRQVAMAKNAQEISKLGSELFDRISNFATHLSKVGGGINSALAAYNKAIGTFDSRILSSARKLKELKATDKEIETPKLLEGAPRPISVIDADQEFETDLLLDDDKDTSRYA
ncbi:MAG TPA: DNA recombination protein RmuC [Alphaproteobacteria bacterium]|nr:DNA recombination protein RmuC [Alphaproteobacteria bacterium]